VIVMTRTFAFFVWQLVTALVVTAGAAALWALAIGSGFVHTFDVALCLVGGVLLVFGAGAMTFQITWSGSVNGENAQRSQPRGRARCSKRLEGASRQLRRLDSRSVPPRTEGVSHAASTALPGVWPPPKEDRCVQELETGSSRRSLLPS